jgi:membrane protein DedA with SNARE-associated domain
VTALVAALGPLGVFALMVPESACIPIPSEATLLCAGFGVSQGWMPLWAAVAAATAGNLLGSLIAYGVGRAAARKQRRGAVLRALSRCEGLFDRHGNRAVFLARLMPLARSFVSLPAGYAKVTLAPFVAMTLAGCAIWAAAFTVIGEIAGSNWAELNGVVGPAALAATALAGGVVVLSRHGGRA